MREKRWLLCFLVAMCCTFSAWALPSQDKTVTLKLHNVSIETVLDAVKKQTGVNMLYNSQMFKGVPPGEGRHCGDSQNAGGKTGKPYSRYGC